MHIVAFCIFQKSLALIEVSSECDKSSITLFHTIEMTVLVMPSSGNSTFRYESNVVIQLLLILLLGDKTIHAKENLFFKNTDLW